MNTPALDFCQRVRTWQDADGASSGLPLLVPARDLSDLDALLTGVQVSGPSPLLEDRARRWLIGYRELEDQQRVLTEAQRAELNAVVDQLRDSPYQTHAQARPKPSVVRFAVTLLAVGIAVAAILSVTKTIIGDGNGSHPPAGISHPQQDLRDQITAKIADVNTVTTQITQTSDPAQRAALKGQRMAIAGIACSDAAQISDGPLPAQQRQWVTANCLAGVVRPGSPYYSSGS